jgi:hypothetical protein
MAEFLCLAVEYRALPSPSGTPQPVSRGFTGYPTQVRRTPWANRHLPDSHRGTRPKNDGTLAVDARVEGPVIQEGSRNSRPWRVDSGSTGGYFLSDTYDWSDTYDRELPDVLALESEVAQSSQTQSSQTQSSQKGRGSGHGRVCSCRCLRESLLGLGERDQGLCLTGPGLQRAVSHSAIPGGLSLL